MLLTFVAKAFEKFLGVILWLAPVTLAIVGLVAGWGQGAIFAFLGFVLGAVVGLILDIVWGGIVVTFVNIGKDVSEFKKDVAELRKDVAKISSGNTAV